MQHFKLLNPIFPFPNSSNSSTRNGRERGSDPTSNFREAQNSPIEELRVGEGVERGMIHSVEGNPLVPGKSVWEENKLGNIAQNRKHPSIVVKSIVPNRGPSNFDVKNAFLYFLRGLFHCSLPIPGPT